MITETGLNMDEVCTRLKAIRHRYEARDKQERRATIICKHMGAMKVELQDGGLCLFGCQCEECRPDPLGAELKRREAIG